ncbi:MAG: serine/threonine dehydratase [Rhodobacteraceae bacterium]|nr:serine/threonine dehydratase [Paracoccaceae bacterium]
MKAESIIGCSSFVSDVSAVNSGRLQPQRLDLAPPNRNCASENPGIQVTTVISPDDISAAYAHVKDRVRATPVLTVEAHALAPIPVALKLEQTQHTGSFKTRGAMNACLAAPLPEAGVVTASGGNAGAAIAYAAGQFGAACTVFSPDITTDTKVARMEGYGATVIRAGRYMSEIAEKLIAFSNETGARIIHPYDDAHMIAGNGTAALEFDAQSPDLDTLFIAVGGGGLISGIAAWYQTRAKVIAVETEHTAAYAATLAQGPGAEVTPSGVAASSLGASQIGKLNWEIMSSLNVGSLLVTDDDVVDAQRRLWETARLIGEPGAATALAPLTSGKYVPAPDEKVGVLICGGNAEPNWFLD